MAWIRNVKKSPIPGSTSNSVTPLLGDHVSGDLLLVKVSQNGGTGTISPPSGWNIIPGQTASGSCRSVFVWKIAASSSEDAPVITSTLTDWIVAACLVIADVKANPFGDVVSGTDYVRTDWNNVNITNSGALTTAEDNCLLIYAWCVDTSPSLIIDPLDARTLVDTAGNMVVDHTVTFVQAGAAGPAPTVPMRCTVSNEGGNGWVLAIRNSVGGALQPDISPDITIINYYGDLGAIHSPTPTWQAPNAVAAEIGGISCGATVPTISTATPGGALTAYTTVRTNNITASEWSGGYHAISPINMDGKLFIVQSVPGTVMTSSTLAVGGFLLVLTSGSSWVAYQIAADEYIYTQWEIVIATRTSTVYASSGTIDWSAVDGIGYFYHRQGSNTTPNGWDVRNACVLNAPVPITGGGANRPATYIDFRDAWYPFGQPSGLCKLSGKGQVLSKLPVQIGDGGVHPTFFDSSAQSLEFPAKYSSVKTPNVYDWQMPSIHSPGDLHFIIKAGPNDHVALGGSLIASDTTGTLIVDSSSSEDADYSLTGLSITNFITTCNPPIDFSGALFNDCPEIDGKAAHFTTCTILASTGTHALALDAGGSCAGTSFTKGQDTYALNLREAGTYNLSGAIFSGYTTPVHVTVVSGTVTITLADGQSAPAYVSDGATVVIAAKTVPISISGIAEGSSLAVYRNSDHAEIVAPTTIDATGEYTASYTYTVPVPVTVTVRKATSEPKYLPYSAQGVISGSGLSMIVSQIPAPF